MSEVTLKNLTKVYGSNTVVDHINLTVADGTLTSILGPSGCGKTTTLRMIAGFEVPQEGDILFDNASVRATPVHKRGIGMVFQSYALFPHMTVYQNVAYGLEQQKVEGGGAENPSSGSFGNGSHGGVCQPQTPAALRWSAAARGLGPGSGDSSPGPSSGRVPECSG